MRAFLGATAIAMMACGGEASRVASTSEPIIGGDADTTSTNIVMVYVHSQTKNGGWVDCTGTVIAPHVVVTAGHCLDVAMLGLGAAPVVEIFVGQDIYASPPASEFYAVASTASDPLFAEATVASKGHDVGVVVTQSALPVTPVPFVRTALGDSLVGQSVRLAGYGLTNPADTNSDGRRNSATTTIATIDALTVATADQLPSGCEGDSGGAMLVMLGGVETLAGVISHGNAIDNCKGTSIGERVDLEASFLEPIVEQYDPGFLPMPDAGGDASATTDGGDGGASSDGTNGSSCTVSTVPSRSATRAFVLAAFAVFAIALTRRRALKDAAGRGSDRSTRR